LRLWGHLLLWGWWFGGRRCIKKLMLLLGCEAVGLCRGILLLLLMWEAVRRGKGVLLLGGGIIWGREGRLLWLLLG